jgi:tetratricopeptide (TPR) repeat protein
LHEDARKAEIRERIVHLKPKEGLIKLLAQDASEDIFSEGDVTKRLSMMERFYTLFPPSTYADLVHQNQLRILAKDLKDLEQLREKTERWLSEEPDNRIANFSVGYWFTEKEIDLERAVWSLKKALELIKRPDPRDKPENQPDRDWKQDLRTVKGQYLDTLGWALYKLGHSKEAEDALKKAAAILDFDHSLFYHLGRLYEHQGLRDEAIKAYLRSMEAGDEIQEASLSLERLVGQSNPLQESLYKYFAQKQAITTFTDVTEKSGLASIKGGRVAWGDYDGDGFDDLLVDGHRLFRNNQDGTFTEVTHAAGLKETSGATGGVWADFNNDGFLDFYMMTGGGNSPGRFWKNRGDGTFMDITHRAIHRLDHYPTEGAAWGDYNGDGWVDLYLANYEKPYSQAIHLGIGTPDILWKNNGDETFSDITQEAGLVTLEKMNGRGVNWGDYNNDGLLDLFVSNYRLDPNFLWRNNGDGSFTNVAQEQGVEGREKRGHYGHTIGSEWGDYDNDGDLDLFSANLAHPRYIGYSDKSMLLENIGLPDYRFRDRAKEAGIRYQETHSDPSFADYDNDGDLDLFITAIYPKAKSVLYRNKGQGKFEDVTWRAGVRVSNSWGSAFADFDGDGDLDLVVGSHDGIRLFANDGNKNHWLHVRVAGRSCNQDGIGSRVVVKSHALQQIREVQGGKGTGAQHSLPVEFGLGDYNGPVDLEIRNACGQAIRRAGVTPNQMVTVGD